MSMIINSYSFGGYTARTTAFLAATGITDTTIANALNTMDLALISNGLDTKMKALYPLVGGTATTHKYNFMNPADTDAAFRIVWAGGITHSGTGVLFNGSTGFGDTKLIPSTDLSLNSTALSCYSRTNANNQYDMGATITAGFHRCELPARYGDLFYLLINQTAVGSVANTLSTGLLSASRTASNLTTAYRNGTSLGSSSNASNTLPNFSMYVGAGNFSGSASEYSSKEYCMFSISDGLTAADESNFYTLIQAMQVALGRNV